MISDFKIVRKREIPHIIVKLWPGRNDEIKNKLAKRIANTVAEELNVEQVLKELNGN